MPISSIRNLNATLSSPIYRGSVQNLYSIDDDDKQIISETTSGGSVFDVGTIYDIPGSDTARTCFRHFVFMKLADPKTWQDASERIRQQAHFKGEKFNTLLETLCQQGANTHHIGMLDRESGDVFRDSFPPAPSNLTLIENFHINKPQPIKYTDTHFYDYSSYNGLDSFVVPLEYIVRFGVTSGSSILRIYDALQGAAKTQYLNELGQTKPLTPWSTFNTPINDFTTKYEPSDRSISKQEAALISCINGDLFVDSIILSQLASYVVQDIFATLGLYLWDLKWEIATKNGALVFVDTIDTDSVRATLKVEQPTQSLEPNLDKHLGQGCFIHFNKQAMRDYYKIMHPDWLDGVNDAKKIADAKHSPFTDILLAGQKNKHYPDTPIADPDFLKIQQYKFEYIANFVQQEGQPSDYKRQALDIAKQEIAYYSDAGKFEHYMSLNAS